MSTLTQIIYLWTTATCLAIVAMTVLLIIGWVEGAEVPKGYAASILLIMLCLGVVTVPVRYQDFGPAQLASITVNLVSPIIAAYVLHQSHANSYALVGIVVIYALVVVGIAGLIVARSRRQMHRDE